MTLFPTIHCGLQIWLLRTPVLSTITHLYFTNHLTLDFINLFQISAVSVLKDIQHTLHQ